MLRQSETLADVCDLSARSSQMVKPWLILALAAVITAGILALDVILWRHFGVEATFSRAVRWLFDRWPLTAAVLFVWIGIVIGHLIPTGG
jgi:hypothetical protein